MNDTFFFDAREWAWPALAVLAVGGFILWSSYRRFPVRGWPRWLGFFLKATGFLLLALCLLEPMRRGSAPKRGANDIVLLADNSRGMVLGEDAPGEMVQKLIAETDESRSELLDALDENFRLQTYLFDRRLKRTVDYSELDFSGDDSALGSALTALVNRYQSRPLAALLVFTDGNASDLEALEAFSRRDDLPPLFPIAIGREGEFADLAIRSLAVSETSFEDAPVKVVAHVGGQGFSGRRVSAVVSDESGAELARETLALPTDENRDGVFRIRVPVVKPGVSFLTLTVLSEKAAEGEGWKDLPKAQKVAGEVTLENNRRLAVVDRGRGPYRVLYVSGRPNWDYKFLRRALLRDSEMDLVALVRIARREPKFEWRGREGESANPLFRGFGSDIPEETLRYDEPVLMRLNTRDGEELRDGFPRTEAGLFGDYRAVILDDVEADFFTLEQMNLLERFVTVRGGSVLMMGGGESFQPGGYEDTPIGDLLPVYVNRLSTGAAALGGRFSLSREGYLEPWARLRIEQSDEELREAHMPDFHVINRLQAIKPGASVMATVTDTEQRQHPALVVQRYGEGRSAALTIGDMWRWGMRDPGAHEDLDKSWRQLARWLVNDVPDRVEVTAIRESDGASDAMRFEVQVRDAAFRPQDDASVKISMTGPDGEAAEIFAEPSLKAAGVFTATLYPESSGAYRATVTVRDVESTVLAEKQNGWTVNRMADELRSLTVNRQALQTLAEASGGRVLAPDELMAFVKDELAALDAPVMETWTRPLWHTSWLFVLALILFVAEWGLRRWKGVI